MPRTRKLLSGKLSGFTPVYDCSTLGVAADLLMGTDVVNQHVEESMSLCTDVSHTTG